MEPHEAAAVIRAIRAPGGTTLDRVVRRETKNISEQVVKADCVLSTFKAGRQIHATRNFDAEELAFYQGIISGKSPGHVLPNRCPARRLAPRNHDSLRRISFGSSFMFGIERSRGLEELSPLAHSTAESESDDDNSWMKSGVEDMADIFGSFTNRNHAFPPSKECHGGIKFSSSREVSSSKCSNTDCTASLECSSAITGAFQAGSDVSSDWSDSDEDESDGVIPPPAAPVGNVDFLNTAPGYLSEEDLEIGAVQELGLALKAPPLTRRNKPRAIEELASGKTALTRRLAAGVQMEVTSHHPLAIHNPPDQSLVCKRYSRNGKQQAHVAHHGLALRPNVCVMDIVPGQPIRVAPNHPQSKRRA